jgi:homoserine O-succinyltransferase/O-acetyltransferase
MPIAVEPPRSRRAATAPVSGKAVRREGLRREGLLIALVNNMPDAALEATERQFLGLLGAAAGPVPLTLRLSSLPEVPRGTEAQARISRSYWPLADLLGQPSPDALIVTGTEPREPHLAQEPYWESLVGLLEWAQEYVATSIWSCLAAHAAVLKLDRIERRRLPQKRSGVYAHAILAGHPLLGGVAAPMHMPHSRWNELPVPALRDAGYTVLSWSAETGADTFLRDQRSPLLFFQGHPEYEPTTLLREYRRDVGRYLSGSQAQYPALPEGCFTAAARATLEAFREQALTQRSAELLDRFPFAAAAGGLSDRWRSAAVAIYRNWLSSIAAARSAPRSAAPVSFAPR